MLLSSMPLKKRYGARFEAPRIARKWRIALFLVFIVLLQWFHFTRKQHGEAIAPSMQAVRSAVRSAARQAAKSLNQSTCEAIARKYEEPYSALYKDRKIEVDGPMYALYRWDKKMTKKQLNWQRNLTENRKMPSNTRIFFKILDSLLFVDESDIGYHKVFPMGPHTYVKSILRDRYDRSVELLLLALEVYDIPDVDFVLELEDFTYDTAPDWDPVLTYSMRNGDDKKGFTFPSYDSYVRALGTYQMAFQYECLEERFPLEKRIKKAVWRGSSTGPPIDRLEDVKLNKRVALSGLSQEHPDVLDAGIVAYVQANLEDLEVKRALEELAPLGNRLGPEDYNKYSVVLDLDGNAWSDRFPTLLASNTPVLKQEYTQWNDYFGHLLTDKKDVHFFKDDLSDLVSQVEDVLVEYDYRRQTLEATREHALEFAAEHVSQLGVIRAAAYAITKYASFQDWLVEEEDSYVIIPAATCCKLNSRLPTSLIKQMNPDYKVNTKL